MIEKKLQELKKKSRVKAKKFKKMKQAGNQAKPQTLTLIKEDVPKIAFKTRWGLYEFLIVRFGVLNAPT